LALPVESSSACIGFTAEKPQVHFAAVVFLRKKLGKSATRAG
jgi:hypothetical protein